MFYTMIAKRIAWKVSRAWGKAKAGTSRVLLAMRWNADIESASLYRLGYQSGTCTLGTRGRYLARQLGNIVLGRVPCQVLVCSGPINKVPSAGLPTDDTANHYFQEKLINRTE